ncbi:FliM/FliN family flagellar motor switch protein [Pantoea agglomerans]
MRQIRPLNFPHFSHASARSQNQLTSGYCFPFTLGDETGTLSLLNDNASSPTTLTHWCCGLGNFSLGDAMPLLNMLSLSPLTALSPDDEWQSILFNHYLSPELASLFGEIKLCNIPEQHALRARLFVRLGDRHAECSLQLSHVSLSYWLKQPGWQPRRYALPHSLTYSQPLVLGRITLHTPQLQALRVGDVLIPPVNYFTPDGQGSLILAGQQLWGTLQLPHHFVLNHMESTTLNPYDADETNPVSLSEPLQSEDNPHIALLPLSLEVRCGRTRLTLGELQQLQLGRILTLDNMTPGEAGLYHGDTLIARGELVDVEGQLGLQLTQLLLTLKQVAE